MRDKALIFVIVVAGLFAVVASNLWARLANAERIGELQGQAAEMMRQRDSVRIEAESLKSTIDTLQAQRQVLEVERETLREEVNSLEAERLDDRISVRRLATVEDLQLQFESTFPQVRGSDWGLIEMYDEEEDLPFQYLAVPSFFAQTFIINKNDADSWRAQRDRLALVDTLGMRVDVLQDSVATVLQARGDLYQAAYDTAYARYLDVNAELVDELRKPSFSLGSTTAIAGGIVVGVAIGALARGGGGN